VVRINELIKVCWLILFIVYIYPLLIYPILLYIFNFNKKKATHNKRENVSEEELPFVSLIISAFNEEDTVEGKIRNSLEIDYPKDKLEIIVVSDGSLDRTDKIVGDFHSRGVRLIRVEGRRGKTICQNIAVEEAHGEIIVFSDANTMYDSKSIRALVDQLMSDSLVGCVSGELGYITKFGSEKESIYWKYEIFIKRLESLFYSEVGVNGAMYAVRKKEYVPLRGDLISDFIEPLEIVKITGKLTKHCISAKAYEYEPAELNIAASVKRKRRIFVRSIRGLFFEKELLNPFRYPIIAFELISHKLLRWINPIILIFLLILPLFNLRDLFFLAVIEYIILFLAFIGNLDVFGLFGRFSKILRALNYFLWLNIADFLGWIDLAKGERYIKWETKR